ncbi:ABC transporter substrate-binding protein [Paenibacillus rhizoplanae]
MLFNMYMINNAQNYNEGLLKDTSKIGVKALNNTTLQVTLKEKTSYFIQLLAESIYLPVYAKTAKANNQWATDLKSMVTNGPFKLKTWKSNEISIVKKILLIMRPKKLSCRRYVCCCLGIRPPLI